MFILIFLYHLLTNSILKKGLKIKTHKLQENELISSQNIQQ